MKQISLLILSLLFIKFGFSQTTYYWVGGTGPVSFTTNSNWNTSLSGTGTARPIADTTDILIIDGTNVGGSNPTTGAINVTSGSTACAQLRLINYANITIQRATATTGTIDIKGDATSAEDLYIESNSSLSLTSLDTLWGNTVNLNLRATGRIFGNFSATVGQSRISTLNTQAGGSLFFENGSVCTVKTYAGTYPFGGNSCALKGIIFNSGATLVYAGGTSIWTQTSSYRPLIFNPGSNLKIDAPVPSNYVSASQFFSNKAFANVIIAANRRVEADNFYTMGDLTIEQGASFYLKASGVTPISGNILNNGLLKSNVGFTSSCLLLYGTTPQTIGGIGIYDSLGAISISTNSKVVLNADIKVFGSSTSSITGKLDLQNHTISGTSGTQFRAAQTASVNVTTATIGTNTLSLDPSMYNGSVNNANVSVGLLVSGNGIAPNSYIIGTSSGTSSITISTPIIGNVSSVTITGFSPTLETSNVNGVDGAITATGTRNFGIGTNYVFNGPTVNPFSTSTNNSIGNLTINANVKANKSITLNGTLNLQSGKFSIASADSIRIASNSNILGAPFDSSKYIVLEKSGSSVARLRMDSIISEKLFPIGSSSHYLPVTISPTQFSAVTTSVFEGITTNGTVSGIPLSSNQQNKVVNAVWLLNKISGPNNASINIGWDSTLEGSFFRTLSNNQIGIIQNNGTGWTDPFGSADNSINTTTATINNYGAFSVGSSNQIQSLNFAAIPVKVYGDSDFQLNVTSLNTTQPVTYTSSNTQIATVSSTGLVHIVGAGDVTISVSQLSDGNFPDTTASKLFHVDKRSLTITADNKSKYERDPNPTFTFSYAGFVLGENENVLLIAPIVSSTALTNSPAGNYPITISGASAANYSMNYVSGTLTIIPKQTQTITFPSIGTKTYGDSDFSANITSTNTSIPIDLISSNINVATIGLNNQIHIVGAGNTTLTASQAGNNFFFPANDVQVVLNVSKATLVITVNDTSKYQGLANPVFTLSYAGFVNRENSSVLQVAPSVSTTATLNSPQGTYPITATGAVSSNYQISYIPGTLTIQPSEPFIFVFPLTKNYGDADFNTLSNSYNTTNPIIYSSSNTAVATISSTGVIHVVGVGTTNINASQASDGVYAAGNITRQLTVSKAPLTIKANDTFRYEGFVNPSFTCSYTGFVNGESSNVLTNQPSITTTAVLASLPGTYPINVSNAVAANYQITFIPGTFTILARQNQYITFDSIPNKIYGNPDFSAVANSTNNSIPIVYTSSDTNVVKIVNGNMIHIKAAGSVSITASQTGSNAYFPASDVIRSFIINKANLIIKVKDTLRNEGVINPSFTANYTGFVYGENPSVLITPVTYQTTATVNSDPGTYSITASGATSNNYNISYIPGILTVLQNQFTFPVIPNKVYGANDFSASVTTTNTTNPITYSSSNLSVATISSSGAIHIVGAGTTEITAQQQSDGLNPPGFKMRALTVNKATLNVIADNKTKYEGEQNPALTISYVGFVLGENESSLTNVPTVSTIATQSSTPGTYSILVSGGSAENYNLNLINGLLTVLANQTQTITFNALLPKTYGNPDFSAGATSTNNSIPIVYTSSDTNVIQIQSGGLLHIKGAGVVTITASQPAVRGFIQADSVSRILIVNKANLSISVKDTFKYQGENNPLFNVVYNGFVLNESSADLLTLPVIQTFAAVNSIPGIYTLNPMGATSLNYNISYSNGKLSVYPTKDKTQSINYLVNANGNLSINIYSETFNLGDLRLYTVSGQFIAKKNIYVPAGFSSSEMPLKNITPGVYLLVFYEKDRTISKLININR